MHTNWFFFLIRVGVIVFTTFWIVSPLISQAESGASLETKGTIGFYGVYESENKPQPNPPDGGRPISQQDKKTAKTENRFLPQLGQVKTNLWLGIGILFLVILFIKKRKTWK